MASNKEVGDPCQFDKLSVRELKIYLRDRGAHVSGNRPELIKRARGILQIGKRTLKEIDIQDNNNKLERQEELFTTPLGEKLPEPGSLKGCWEDNVLKIPFFRTEDLYNYLVLNRSRTFDNQNMNARKQLKAKVFYEDGHVHSVRYNHISHECSHCYIRAKVIPSLPSDVKKKDYEPWACLSKVSGKVHAAGCNCAAGEGESCNHVAALLYALVDISSKQKDGLNAPTSTKCKWNQPRKRKISPQKSQHLVFKKLKFENDTLKKVSPSTKCKVDNLHKVKPLNSLTFGEKLKKCAPHAAFLLSDSELVAPKEPIPVLPILHSVDFFYKDSVDLKSPMCENNFETYFKSLNCKQDDCFLIENSTKRQHKSYHWKDARAGRLTSSNFGTICKKKTETKPDILLRSIMGYNDEFETAATKWGRSHEPAAKRVYQKHIQITHPGLKLFSSGLVVKPSIPHLGSSPDGIVDCCKKCTHTKGVLEIKCPYKFRNCSPEEACVDKTFCCSIVHGKVTLKRNHNYYFQVQGQMALTERKWCDFFVWTLKGHSVERIPFDNDFWVDMLCKLNSFYIKAVIPELFTERVKRGKELM